MRPRIYRIGRSVPSDTRFDQQKIYKANIVSETVYDIRGKYIHKTNSAGQPVYEIRGDYIYKAHVVRSPNSRIRENKFHKAHIASQAIYEIR